jgi:hypothetical protein
MYYFLVGGITFYKESMVLDEIEWWETIPVADPN